MVLNLDNKIVCCEKIIFFCGFTIGNSVRAVNIIKTPLRDDGHRRLLSSLSLDFYWRDEQSGRFGEYAPTDPQFGQQIDSLAQSLLKLLDTLLSDV